MPVIVYVHFPLLLLCTVKARSLDSTSRGRLGESLVFQRVAMAKVLISFFFAPARPAHPWVPPPGSRASARRPGRRPPATTRQRVGVASAFSTIQRPLQLGAELAMAESAAEQP